MTPRQTLLNHRRALGCQKPSAPGRLANSTPILLCFMRTRLSSVFAGAPRELQILVCGVAWEERAGSCSQPTGAGCVGKLRGSLLEGQDTNGPLFPTTWAQQARRVRRRGPTRQPEARRWQGRQLLCGQFLVPGGNGTRPPVIFRAGSMPRGATHTSTVATWLGARWALFWAKVGEERQGLDLLSFVAWLRALCRPTLDLLFSGPQREDASQLGPPGSCGFADLHPSCAYFYVGWEKQMAPSKSLKTQLVLLPQSDLSSGR